MNIWLITVGEPLPTDGENQRLYRTGILAELLERKGHRVIWWTSSVNHVTKKQRCLTDKSLAINPNFQIKIIRSINYKINVSLARMINHYHLAKKFHRLALSEEKPDIIVCSLPTLFLSMEAVKYGKGKSVPVVLDIRDLWPDIFIELVPEWGRGLVRVALTPVYKITDFSCENTYAIIGITPAYVKWGENHGQRQHSILNKDFPLGYSDKEPSEDALIEAMDFWREYEIAEENGEFIVCFFGTMGRQFDLETVINAAKLIYPVNHNIKFILCGSGDNLEHYKRLARNCSNIVFPGWVHAHHIWVLMRLASVGIAPYRNVDNFIKNLPNKPIEYISAGLPIISGLSGELQTLLETNHCGVIYDEGDSEQLAKILMGLYEEPEILKTMSANALSLYKERFVAEKVYSDMIEHLELICSEYNKGGE